MFGLTTPVLILDVILIALTAASTIYMVMDSSKHKDTFSNANWGILLFIGLLTDFLDTLGIGSFSPTTALYRATKTCDDKDIPGTLNVGHTIPVVTEAVIFTKVVEVEPMTLIVMVAAALIGAVIGAGIVSKMPVKTIRLAMGAALIVVAGIMFLQYINVFPSGGDAIGLTGGKLIIGAVVNFVLGSLMTIGVGLYAPCMALVYGLGMSPAVAFPIMMCSCAFLMPAASLRFIKEGAYDRKASLALTIGGFVGVLIAVYIFTSLPMNILKILVMIVIIYTGITLLRDGMRTAEQ